MRRCVSQLWKDEGGFIISAELVLISTLLVVGLVAGLACLRAALIGELEDVAGSIGSLNQSYWYKGYSGRSVCGQVKSATAGSSFVDRADGGIVVPADISGGPLPYRTTPAPAPAPQAVPCPGGEGPCPEGTVVPSAPGPSCGTCGPDGDSPSHGPSGPLTPSPDPKSIPIPDPGHPPTNAAPAPQPSEGVLPQEERRPPMKPSSEA